jgi:hypothetical protein
MAELKRIDEEFPAVELVTVGIPPKQPEGPQWPLGQVRELCTPQVKTVA